MIICHHCAVRLGYVDDQSMANDSQELCELTDQEQVFLDADLLAFSKLKAAEKSFLRRLFLKDN